MSIPAFDYVVCTLVADLPIPRIPSEIVHCCGCNQRIWLGNDAPRDIPTICMECMTAELREKGHDDEGTHGA